MNTAQHPETASIKLFTTPSGMGGFFTVKIVKDLADGHLQARIHMPRNPDFHGNFVTRRRDQLTPVAPKASE